MWNKLLDQFLAKTITKGTLIVHMPDGGVHRYGDGTRSAVTLRLHDAKFARKAVLNPQLAVGEGYTDGTLTLDNDDLYGFMALVQVNLEKAGPVLWQRPLAWGRQLTRSLQQFNPIKRSRQNVAHHYDLSGKLYDLFLDKDRQYSCGYYAHDDDSLDTAQDAKKRHIAQKLLLKPGMSVLDIGCGWGGMALSLARDYGARVTGITLSQEQYKIATERARDAGLSDRVTFQLMDYRNVRGPFDRIVSVGMFEHVGVPQYRTFFRQLHQLLQDNGIALIHTIGRAEPPGTTSPWLRKYIFPGGYSPALSEMMQSIEHEALFTTDIEFLNRHYARTLHEWHRRFMINIDAARDLYDDRFCRMWRFYLVSAEQAFLHFRQAVFQVQITRRQDAVPMTRTYMYPPENEGRMHEAAE